MSRLLNRRRFRESFDPFISRTHSRNYRNRLYQDNVPYNKHAGLGTSTSTPHLDIDAVVGLRNIPHHVKTKGNIDMHCGHSCGSLAGMCIIHWSLVAASSSLLCRIARDTAMESVKET